MMSNPDAWPVWPFLPLIKNDGGDRLGTAGFIFNNPNVKFTVFFGNVFMPPDLKTCPKEVYKSFEEILQAGWRVD